MLKSPQVDYPTTVHLTDVLDNKTFDCCPGKSSHQFWLFDAFLSSSELGADTELTDRHMDR